MAFAVFREGSPGRLRGRGVSWVWGRVKENHLKATGPGAANGEPRCSGHCAGAGSQAGVGIGEQGCGGKGRAVGGNRGRNKVPSLVGQIPGSKALGRKPPSPHQGLVQPRLGLWFSA